jgi:tRNA 5-methylaminomethyl-2-thiouridine biosynthesis bifunctional protein
MPGIEVEPLQFDLAGAPFSERYGDVYASRNGALEQARHVFLGGNELPARWRGRDQFVILETGFGLGTNFLATWQAWRDDPHRPRRLHFVSIERHPLSAGDLARCAPASLGALAAELARAWPPPLSGLHRRTFEDGAVTLTLGLGDARTLIPEMMLGADSFFLDGFAPERNPDLWDASLLKALARLARPGAMLSTWTVARTVRDALTAGGFEVQLRAGFGTKRHMLAARYAPRFRTRRHEPPSPYCGRREAIVIGAGLAGCCSAAALARRGWQVTLIENGAVAACGASALPSGLLHPTLAIDDSHAARLLRAGFLFSRRQLNELRDRISDPPRHRPCTDQPLMAQSGALQLVGDGLRDDPWAERLLQQRWPTRFVRWCSADEAGDMTGLRPRRGGLWFEDGAIVSAARWCQALLASAPAIRLHTDSQAVAVTRHSSTRQGSAWLVESRGRTIVEAPIVVVACAMDAPRLLQTRFAPVRPIRGRITRLAAGELTGLRAGITGLGYVLPGLDGRVSVGATYEPIESDQGPGIADQSAHETNLARLRKLLDSAAPVRVDGGFDGVRCVATDRMPLAGAVPDENEALAAGARLQGAHLSDLPRRGGLYGSFALGSRGLALAPLLGELIACLVEGEPLPLERSLASTVDPARYLLRRLRTNRAS